MTQSRLALAGAVMLGAMLVLTAASFVWTPDSTTAMSLADRSLPPSASHPMGTDLLGRDVLSRVMAGGQVCFALGLAASFVTAVGAAVIGPRRPRSIAAASCTAFALIASLEVSLSARGLIGWQFRPEWGNIVGNVGTEPMPWAAIAALVCAAVTILGALSLAVALGWRA